jgi:hypothetical protein
LPSAGVVVTTVSGAVRFPVTGPVRYSLTAKQAIELCRLVRWLPAGVGVELTA